MSDLKFQDKIKFLSKHIKTFWIQYIFQKKKKVGVRIITDALKCLLYNYLSSHL